MPRAIAAAIAVVSALAYAGEYDDFESKVSKVAETKRVATQTFQNEIAELESGYKAMMTNISIENIKDSKDLEERVSNLDIKRKNAKLLYEKYRVQKPSDFLENNFRTSLSRLKVLADDIEKRYSFELQLSNKYYNHQKHETFSINSDNYSNSEKKRSVTGHCANGKTFLAIKPNNYDVWTVYSSRDISELGLSMDEAIRKACHG